MRAEGHKEGEKYQAKRVMKGGCGKGELCRKMGSPHESDHSKVKVERKGSVGSQVLSNSFGKDKKKKKKQKDALRSVC